MRRRCLSLSRSHSTFSLFHSRAVGLIDGEDDQGRNPILLTRRGDTVAVEVTESVIAVVESVNPSE